MSVGMATQWLALALCVIFAAIRLPEAIRGRGRSVFAVLVLLCVAVALSLSPIYLFVDGILGGTNIANLFIKFCLYTIVLLLGIRCAVAFGSERARRSIGGPLGMAALTITVLVTLVLFVLSDLPESSTALNAYDDQYTVLRYADIGRAYPAYVAACLLRPAFASACDGRNRTFHRVAAAMIGTGFLKVLLLTVLLLFPLDIGAASLIMPFGAIVLVTTGLTMIWLSRRRATGRRSANFLADEHRHPRGVD